MIFLLLFKGNAAKAQLQVKPIHLEQAFEKDTLIQTRMGGVIAAVHVESVISGTVTDETGMAVAGATVQIRGTNKATITDANGAYHLNDTGAEGFLKISALGYCSKEIQTNRADNQVCMLKPAVMGDVVVVGLISSDYDYTASADPTHVAVIEVRDNTTSQPLKAKITIDNDEQDEPATSATNKNGIYKLRRIKENETYRVTVSAEGYEDSVLNIEGWKFNERKETRHVFLKRNNAKAPEQRRIIMGGVRSNVEEPLYIIDGQLANKEMIKNIKPEEIEKIDVLKDANALVLYGRAAQAGVITITTKKRPSERHLAEGVNDKKQTAVEKEKIAIKRIDNFNIAPNPVAKRSVFTISFTSKLNGEYTVQISNALGVLLQSKKITVTEKLTVLPLQANTNWASGIYYVTIIDDRSNVIHVGRFIIE